MTNGGNIVRALLALVGVAGAAYIFIVARRSASWPRVNATIVVSRVERPSKATSASIAFTYTVDGCAYTSRRIAIGPNVSTTGDHAERMVAAFPVGSSVPIAYDPRKPSYGVLLPGVLPRHFFVVMAAAVLVVLAVVDSMGST